MWDARAAATGRCTFGVPYEVHAGADKVALHCEVQIHSLLQDAWAKLSHVDIYRGDAAPQLAEAMER
jgi:ppGpp synthetase/RelA/SpoT-type nucleotidyltranferase